MEYIEFKAKFEGGSADEHKVPAYGAIETLYGVSRSILIPSHYLIEGKVRRRSISSEKYQLYMQPPKAGSFEAILQLGFIGGAAALANPVAVNVTANLISETIMSVVKTAVGKKLSKKESQSAGTLIPPGDLAALAVAVEPGLRRGHNIINNGVLNINFISGTGDQVFLDQSTKEFLNSTQREDKLTVSLMSVGKWDANNKSGSAYDPELGRMIPFSVSKDIDRKSVAAILKSNANYTLGLFDPDEDGSYIAIQFERIVDLDDTVKKIEVYKARESIEEI